MVGYESNMLEMIRKQNPGLSRRFNPDKAIIFKDYDDSSLANIILDLCYRDGLHVNYDVLVVMIKHLAQQRKLPNFGNAGSVRNLLSSIKSRIVSRLDCAEVEDVEIQVGDVVGDDRDQHGRALGDPLEEIKCLYGMEGVVKKLEGYLSKVIVNQKEGKTTQASNWIFTGNPGTGKTTVARKMHEFFQNVGDVCTPNSKMVEKRASDLMGTVVGEAERLVTEAFEEANGGLLFIDEAYDLGSGPYGEKALNALIGLTGNTQNVTVILAGYKKDMQQMQRRNSGTMGRFSEHLEFPDWKPSECTHFVLNLIAKESFSANSFVMDALKSGFEDLKRRPGWSNARDAVTVWRDHILKERAIRVAKLPKITKDITVEDVINGMREYLANRPSGEANVMELQDVWGVADVRLDSAYREVPIIREEQNIRSLEAAPHENDTNSPAQPIEQSTQDILTEFCRVCNEESAVVYHLRSGEAIIQNDVNFTAEQTEILMKRQEAIRRAEVEALRKLEEEKERQRLQREREQDERRRQELERKIKEAEEAAAKIREMRRVQERLRQIGRCPVGFDWIDRGSYYICAGGSHTVPKSAI